MVNVTSYRYNNHPYLFYQYYRNDIIKNSENDSLCYLNIVVFLRWFHFERVIEALAAKEIYHMELNQLLTITKRYCRIDDEVELKTMLNFYHDLGVIVKHGRTVVLQALWLIDLFKKLITVRPFDEMVNNDTPHNTSKIFFGFRNCDGQPFNQMLDAELLFIAKYI